MKKFKRQQEELLSRIAEEIREYGFDSRKGQSFYKKCPFGRAAFHLSLIEHQDDFDVTADVAIRFKDVEELLKREDKLVSKADQQATCTVGAELGNISEGRQKRWTVSDVNDISVVADSILHTFREVGVPYIEEFSDANKVLAVLSGDGPESWLHAPFDEARAERAVAMAFLLKGKECAQKLAQAKLAFLQERKDPGLQPFLALLDRLGLGK